MTVEPSLPREDELQRSVDLYGQNHRLYFDASSDTSCKDCDWAGCLLIPLPEICPGREKYEVFMRLGD